MKRSRHDRRRARPHKWHARIVLLFLAAGGVIGLTAGSYLRSRARPTPAPVIAGPSMSGVFATTVANAMVPSAPPPRGMVWIRGGEFSMGAQDPPGMDRVGMQATEDSRPIHRVYVDGFWMDA